MTRWLTTLTALSIAMLSIGCVRTSHQLSEVGETVTDDEIVGVWEKHDPIFGVSQDRICIEARDDGRYQMLSEDPTKTEVTPFRLVRAAGATYMEFDLDELLHVDASKLNEADQAAAESWCREAHYLFPIRWERRGEWMAQWDADIEVVERLLKEEKLKGHSGSSWPQTIAITSAAVDLENCLKEHGDELYEAAINNSRGYLRSVYRRVSTQVPTKNTELTATP
jgi:hypothetical protein